MNSLSIDVPAEMAKIATHHVHFPEDQADVSEISIEPDADGRLVVNVGFLKVKHQYNIRFRLKDDLGDVMTIYDDEEQKKRIQILTHEQTPEGHELFVELNVEREKLIEEEVVLSSIESPSNYIALVLQASVLGSNQGTPALRHGVHCTRSNEEEKLTNLLSVVNGVEDVSDCSA